VIEEINDLDAAWPALEALLKDSHEYYLPIVGYGPPSEWIEEIRERFRPGFEALLLLVRSGGEGVAFANAMVRTAPGSPPQRFAYLDNVYVLEKFRGYGIGTAVLAHVENWAARKGCKTLRLEVLAGNDLASEFWQVQGFAVRAYALSRPVTQADHDE
jgi:GNAT superfamily N-acetyltransferase